MGDFHSDRGIVLSEFEEEYDERREIRGFIVRETLGEVPRREVEPLSPSTSVAKAIETMNQRKQGFVLVVEDGNLVGIFTERDVLRKIAGQNVDVQKTALKEVMTHSPETLPETATIAYALNEMNEKGYRHIPILDEKEKPIGVVGVRDIVSWLVSLFPESVLTLPPTPGGFPKTAEGG